MNIFITPDENLSGRKNISDLSCTQSEIKHQKSTKKKLFQCFKRFQMTIHKQNNNNKIFLDRQQK